jgi:YD repeat-containing protein
LVQVTSTSDYQMDGQSSNGSLATEFTYFDNLKRQLSSFGLHQSTNLAIPGDMGTLAISYDPRDRVSRIERIIGLSSLGYVELSYVPYITTVTDYTGAWMKYTYDRHGRVIQQHNQLDDVVTIRYNDARNAEGIFQPPLLHHVSDASTVENTYQNLLVNPSFEEDNITPWVLSNAMQSTSFPTQGLNSLAIIQGGGTATQTLMLEPGIYTLSGNSRLAADFSTSSLGSFIEVNSPAVQVLYKSQPNATSVSKPYTILFEVFATSNVDIVLKLSIGGTTAYFDQLQLVNDAALNPSFNLLTQGDFELPSSRWNSSTSFTRISTAAFGITHPVTVTNDDYVARINAFSNIN